MMERDKEKERPCRKSEGAFLDNKRTTRTNRWLAERPKKTALFVLRKKKKRKKNKVRKKAKQPDTRVRNASAS